MITTLIFDADGVLFFHADKLFSERLVAEYGSDPHQVNHFFETIFPECVINKKDLKQELAKYLDDWKWPGTVNDLLEYWYEYEHNLDQPLINYVRNMKQKNITSYVATNNDRYRANWLFEKLNVDTTIFAGLFAAGEMGVAKPEPFFFQSMVASLPEASLPNILFWDDSMRNVVAAREFGMQSELYTDFDAFRKIMQGYLAE